MHLFSCGFALQKVETVEEGVSSWGDVSTSSSSAFGAEVTWQQRFSFLLNSKTGGKNKKGKDSSSSSERIIQALQREGQMRFLIGSSEEAWPAFVGELALHDITCPGL